MGKSSNDATPAPVEADAPAELPADDGTPGPYVETEATLAEHPGNTVPGE